MTIPANEESVEKSFRHPPLPTAVRQQKTRLKALELFASRGFTQTGMRELAAHMGVTPGSLYNHMDSKQTLLFELIEELYECLLNGPAHFPLTQRNPNDRLQMLLTTHINLHGSKGMHFLVAERELHCLDSQQADTIQNLRAIYEQQFVNVLAEVGDMEITPQLRALAKSSVSLLNNLPLWFAQDSLDPARRTQLMNSMASASIAGALQDLKHSSDNTFFEQRHARVHEHKQQA